MKLAAVFADVHLSHTAPTCRRGESDWYAAMERVWQQIKTLAGDLPLLCAGDLFDRSDPPPALINFALDVLPIMYAVPGQHDLPWHGIERMHACAFGTLVRSGRVHWLDRDQFEGLRVRGFGWNQELKPVRRARVLQLALVHRYCWIRGKKHLQADPAGNARVLAQQLQGYDFAVFGDNHLPFTVSTLQPLIYNCGSLMRRAIDQEAHRPSIGIVHDTGEIERIYLSIEDEVFEGPAAKREVVAPLRGRIEQILQQIEKQGDAEGLDYLEAVRHYANGLQDADVAAFMREMLDGVGL